MRLERVDIKDYRGAKRLSVRLGAVTTVIGEHDSGKTSLVSALERILTPADGPTPPVFREEDFHVEPTGQRADSLSITIAFRRKRGDEPGTRGPGPGPAGLGRQLAEAERFSVRVRARRRDGTPPETRVIVLDEHGREVRLDDPLGVLSAVRKRTPAFVIRQDKAVAGGGDGGLPDGPMPRIRSICRRIGSPGGVSWPEIVEVMDDVREAASWLADRLEPTPERPRSIEDLADTPQPLITDLQAAMRPDAGIARHVALLLIIGSLIEATARTPVDPDADPILLFDDIETGLHPIWLTAFCAIATNLPLQQVVTTHSSDVLNWMPLRSIRRLHRTASGVQSRSVPDGTLGRSDLRRVGYHLRLNRGGAFFARCWVLVEGETEAWLIPEFARLMGVEFAGEGIRCIEFAQCGIAPLVKIAQALGIGWVLLADGDRAGQNYAQSAGARVFDNDNRDRILRLDAPDIEHDLFRNGYADVIARAAGRRGRHPGNVPDERIGSVVREATRRVSKPGLALAVLEEANARGGAGVPPSVRRLVEMARALARGAQPVPTDG
jgi:putative ATP-dependent endonuclease of OLD family